LDAVIAAAEGLLGRRLRVLGLSHAKFLVPLRPDEAARIEVTISGPVLEFAVRRDEATIAKGRLDVAPGPAA
jgi:hypothetical protein